MSCKGSSTVVDRIVTEAGREIKKKLLEEGRHLKDWQWPQVEIAVKGDGDEYKSARVSGLKVYDAFARIEDEGLPKLVLTSEGMFQVFGTVGIGPEWSQESALDWDRRRECSALGYINHGGVAYLRLQDLIKQQSSSTDF